MVLSNFDSCGTLVSLDNRGKQANTTEYVRTDLYYTPLEDYYGFEQETSINEPIYLPLQGRIDEHLQSYSQLMEGCEELLGTAPRVFDKDTKERVLYVAQGEAAHALNSQCDILVSDRATTCHILALRSESNENEPLTSLTHVDGTSYENSIRAMIEEHYVHHRTNSKEEKKSDGIVANSMITLRVHVVGGFDDKESIKISSWLMDLLVRLANEQKDSMKMSLETCAISSMNDDGYACPIGRGLGIHLESGNVFLAKVQEDALGPAAILRSVRLWGGHGGRELSVIHTSRSDGVTVMPFSFQPFSRINELLSLPDDIMLEYTSTSPMVEEPEFCDSVRASLKFLRDEKCQNIFGPRMDQPLTFQRSGKSNAWTRKI